MGSLLGLLPTEREKDIFRRGQRRKERRLKLDIDTIIKEKEEEVQQTSEVFQKYATLHNLQIDTKTPKPKGWFELSCPNCRTKLNKVNEVDDRYDQFSLYACNGSCNYVWVKRKVLIDLVMIELE